ncbi:MULTISPECIES: hypothetical protein [unclassified Adlercreutzia]|uniref:hypothetical protein n=1 Tax=unclassified Adlercreutzia TaxID=2636013 RepID=UPI0013EE23C5|nr:MULTISPECIES: hypothetical protein [unclassified Adlercreutzia]
MTWIDVIEALNILPVEVVLTFVYTKVLNMRNVPLFWVVRMVTSIGTSFIRLDVSMPVRLLIGLVEYFAIPYFMSKGRAGYRIIALTVLFIAMSVSEVLGVVLWYALTGMLLVRGDALGALMPEFWLVRVMHLLLVVLLLGVVSVALRRFSGEGHEHGFPLVAGLLITQVLLLSLCIYAMQFLGGEKLFLSMGSLTLSLACVVVDVYLMVVIDRFERQRRAEGRVRMLEEQLSAYLEQYQHVAKSIEGVARLRHDVRNQLQVVNDLIVRGDLVRAREIVEAMAARCEERGDALERSAGPAAGASADAVSSQVAGECGGDAPAGLRAEGTRS